jgi:hypothetical protein
VSLFVALNFKDKKRIRFLLMKSNYKTYLFKNPPPPLPDGDRKKVEKAGVD